MAHVYHATDGVSSSTMRTITSLACSFGFVAMLAGCNKTAEKVPTCAELSAKLSEVTKIAYPGHGDVEMGNSKRDIEACEARAPKPAERRCIMAAKDLAGVTACRKASIEKPGPKP
jgi:hypothetical protein